MTNAFTNNGPVPSGTLSPLGAASSPQGKALNSMAVNSTPSYASSTFQGSTGVTTPKPGVSVGQTSTPGLLPPTNQDVKSMTHPDGTVQTYYPSADSSTSAGSTKNTTDIPAPTSSSSGPNQNPSADPYAPSDTNPNAYATQGVTMEGATPTPNGTQQAAMQTLGYNPGAQQNFTQTGQNSSSYPGLVSQLANEQGSPYNQATGAAINNLNTTAAGNQPLAQNAQNIANTAGEEIKNTGVYGANAGLGYQTGGGDQGFALGGANAMANAAASREQAITAQENAALAGNSQALTAQGQEANAYGTAAGAANTGQSNLQAATGAAAGYAQPTSQFGLLTSPVTGQPISGSQVTNAGATGSTGIPYIDNAVANAYAEYKSSGGSLAAAQALLPGGDAGTIAQQALTAQIKNGGGTGNIPNLPAQETQVQQNNTFGQQNQAAAQNLSSALTSIKAITPYVNQVLASSGLNPTNSKLFNGPINAYISSLGNTEAASQLQGIMTDVQSYAQQIIAAKNQSGTPTSVVEQNAANDPGLLSASELQGVLQTWNTLGQTQLGVLQGNASAGYGGQSGGYSGAAANASPTIPTAPTNTGAPLPSTTNEFWKGLGIEALNGVGSLSAAATTLLGFIAGKL